MWLLGPTTPANTILTATDAPSSLDLSLCGQQTKPNRQMLSLDDDSRTASSYAANFQKLGGRFLVLQQNTILNYVLSVLSVNPNFFGYCAHQFSSSINRKRRIECRHRQVFPWKLWLVRNYLPNSVRKNQPKIL